jgi:hypothetical protein
MDKPSRGWETAGVGPEKIRDEYCGARIRRKKLWK